jgi:hypothetical protein
VQTITGYGDAGAALVADPLTDKIIFTGSPAIGRNGDGCCNSETHYFELRQGCHGHWGGLQIYRRAMVMRGCFQNVGRIVLVSNVS